MRVQEASLTMKLLNPCPVCGAETALAEIEPIPCTSTLRFTDTSATCAALSNPWLCFARRGPPLFID
jgi:hypothetical protein